MTFMKQDINFKLIGIVALVVVGVIILTIFFQSASGSVAGKYKKLVEKYKDVKWDLNETSAQLNDCLEREASVLEQFNETKNYQEESQKGFNQIVTETQSQLEQKSKSLEDTANELETTKSSLELKATKISQLEQELGDLQDKYDSVVNKAEKVIAKADNVQQVVDNCKNNADANTCIAEVQSQYNSLAGNIDSLQSAASN